MKIFFRWLLYFSIGTFFQNLSAQSATTVLPITLTVDLAHPRVIDDMPMAFGASIDGHEKGAVEKMLSPANVAIMLKSGLKPLSYRLRTELGVEAWHWNPDGKWSDAIHKQGYWTSVVDSKKQIMASYGYRLPRRGDTLDEANNDGYSRLDDGDPRTFWKSNPYLTSQYTHEKDDQHPQWVMLDFGKPVFINTACIHWSEPYARCFQIQWANEAGVCFGPHARWHNFPRGRVRAGSGGDALRSLGEAKNFFGKRIPVRYVRILMSESSGTSAVPSNDARDHMGYAIREVEFGEIDGQNKFHDQVIHRPDHRQTVIYVSSTDPWHRACDRDEKTEQPGFDLLIQSGLANHGVLWSVPVLYDTPENAAAEISFLRQRGYLGNHIELGEEPDGQRIDSVDFGALYCQVASAIRRVDRGVEMGGPSFVTIDEEPHDVTYRYDHRPWVRRFFSQLRKHHQEKDFKFLTFEWYPFDDPSLSPFEVVPHAATMLRKAIAQLRRGGIPAFMPLIISEYGYSVFAGRPEVEMAAALVNVDTVAQFLSLGGLQAYLYGYEPNKLECVIDHSWGNLMMLLQNENGDICEKLPTFYAAQLLTRAWASPAQGRYELFLASSWPAYKNADGDLLLSAYLLHRPDKTWSLLLINKSHDRSYRINVENKRLSEQWTPPFDKYSYSSTQYQWHAAEAHGFTSRSEPPAYELVKAEQNQDGIEIPPWSITVISTKK